MITPKTYHDGHKTVPSCTWNHKNKLGQRNFVGKTQCMTQPTTPDANTALVELISANMLQHIITLQQAINSREPNERFPTTQEMALMSKMITGLEKLKRFLAPPRKEQAEKASTRTRSRKSHSTDLAGALLPSLTNNEYSPVGTPDEDEPTEVLSPALQQAIANYDPEAVRFPILEHELGDYEFLFDDTRRDRNHTTMVKGHEYNSHWLQYNLYQYCLPLHERRFYYNPARYHQEIDHGNTSWMIQKYLRGKAA